MMRFGLIAGNGRFPLLTLESARKLGHEVIAIGIQEEASREIENLATRCYWISLGELSRLIEILKRENIQQVVLAGQIKHANIFSSIRPDWRLLMMLAGLPRKNTDALIGGVAKVLKDEGIHLQDSTALLKPLLAPVGVMTRRKPSRDEHADLEYGREIARALATWDVGQSVAVSRQACVAVEAMEGTDAVLRRAASLVNGRPLALVKSGARRKHMLFDVPVVGTETVRIMLETGATALAVDAGRTLMLDREELIQRADQANLVIVGYAPEAP